MFNVKTEAFLFDWFIYDTIIGRYTESKGMFYCLGNLWSVEKDALDELFAISKSENVQEISTTNQYMRYRRIKQYNEMVGNECVCSEKENAMIAIKGDAIKVVSQYGMQSTSETTQAVMYKTLLRSAQSGNLIALRILGIIQCEGIVGRKNVKAGLEHLNKAARWGDITSILAILQYQTQDREKTMEMLKAAVRDSIYEYLLDIAEEKYGVKTKRCNEEILLLRKAFDAKKVKADIYNSMYARLVFSPVIGIKDKEKLLFSDRKELLSEACDLPLHLNNENIAVNYSAFDKMKLKRKDELENIKLALESSEIRTTNSYRPLCLCSDSNFVLDEYISAITNGLEGVNVERYDVSDLREYDYDPTKNNVFLRALSESKPNVVLLVYRGEINERAIDLTKSIICTNMRAKFRLVQPSVTMNLSPVLPICICDKQNAKSLQGLVEIVNLAPLNDGEKEGVLWDMAAEKAKNYKIKVTHIEENALKKLKSLSIDNAEKLLEKVIREQRANIKELNMTSELIDPYIKKMGYGGSHYGFGGAIHES